MQSHLIKLILQRDILATGPTVKAAEAVAFDADVPAHVDGPGIARITGEESVGTGLDGVGPDVVLVVAAVPAVCVGAHGLFDVILLTCCPFLD